MEDLPGLHAIINWSEANIPMFDKIEYSFHKNILLIGDAGGFADSMTGEGIYLPFKAGKMQPFQLSKIKTSNP
uniref:hypothetical protein n=1 Tax=uncultured Dysgonomonas sp. TaxID=206096 RepID=UPI002637750F|nr:hypothetical protein [uncultured Dysgonomonas sp.]